MPICAICGKKDFNDYTAYKKHHRLVHSVHVVELPSVKPVKTTDKTKAQIVSEMEAYIRQAFIDAGRNNPLMGHGE